MGINEKTSMLRNEKVSGEELFTVILHNDDENTFDHVIDSLVDVCKHDTYQAEQCALIAHYKGKCDVKHGDISILKPIKDELVRRGLSVTISQN